MGHVFGQVKEFYEAEKEEDNTSYCTAHDLKIEQNDITERKCYEFNNSAQGRGYSGYDSLFYEFVDQSQSTMGDSSNLSEQW